MRNRDRCGFTIIIGIITSVITIVSVAAAIFLILDHKKRKADKELEEYLESTIS